MQIKFIQNISFCEMIFKNNNLYPINMLESIQPKVPNLFQRGMAKETNLYEVEYLLRHIIWLKVGMATAILSIQLLYYCNL